MKEIAKAMMWRAAIWLALFPWLAVMAIVSHVRAQGADDVNALSRQVIHLYQEGRAHGKHG
jgi:hypothetical protein